MVVCAKENKSVTINYWLLYNPSQHIQRTDADNLAGRIDAKSGDDEHT